MSQMRIWADPAHTRGVPFAKTLITPIGGDSPLASRMTDAGGSTAWDELCPQRGVPYVVSIEAPGFAPFAERFENLFEDLDITLQATGVPAPPPPTSGGVSRLSLRGTELYNGAGKPVFLRGADAFCGFEIYLRHGRAPLIPVFEELQRYRVNCLRTWSMSVNLQHNEFGRPPFDPRTFGNYYLALPDYFAFAAEYGFYQYLGLFPDVQLINPDRGWQQGHWDQVWDRVKDLDSLFAVEFQNEAAAKSFNQVSPGFQTRSPNRPWVGTSYADSDPAYQTGTFPTNDLGGGPLGDVHPSRSYPAHIVDCCPVKNIYYLTNKAVVIGEPDRYGWRGNTNRRQAELSANATRAGAVAAFFHSMRGERCEVFDPETKDAAEGWYGAYGPI